MSQVYRYQENATSKGHWESVMVKANSSAVFSELTGPGVINSLWLTTFPINEAEDLELASKVFLNIYWEGSETAAVSVPLSDFFCQPLELQEVQNHFFHATNNQLLFTTTLPMPFRKMAKLEVTSELDREFELFYGIDLEYKSVEDDALYLHTYWQKSADLSPDDPFLLLPETEGQGKYLGTHLSLVQRNVKEGWPWYTRPITVSLDAKAEDAEPSLYIKTLDDFFGSGWWDREPEHNTYTYPFLGRPLVETDPEGNLEIALYKYHVRDPLWFHERIKIEIGKNWNWGNQQISHGDWTTTAFLYLKEAERD